MPGQFEMLVVEKVFDIFPAAGEKIIDAKNVAARRNKPLAKVRAEEPRPSRHQKPSLQMHSKAPTDFCATSITPIK